MTYTEAILTREASLNGRPVAPERAAEAIEVIRTHAAFPPVTRKTVRTIDNVQVRLLEDELRGRP